MRKIARSALHLREARLQARLAALQDEAVHRAGEDARRWRQLPEPTAVVGRRGVLSFRDDAFWLKEGEAEAGPLCPSCWGREHRSVLMQPSAGRWSCPTGHRAVLRPDSHECRRPPGRPCHVVSGVEAPRRDLALQRENP